MLEILKNMVRGRHSAITDPNLHVQIESGTLTLSYPSRTNAVIFDVSNANGQIVIKGNLDLEKESNQIDISALRNGPYTLYLIDGSELIKYPFTINR